MMSESEERTGMEQAHAMAFLADRGIKDEATVLLVLEAMQCERRRCAELIQNWPNKAQYALVQAILAGVKV
jgi:hypothetical protein